MYNYSAAIRGNVVKFRKWKVKDRKKYIKALEEDSLSDSALDVLVYDCLENPNIALTEDEFRFVITRIREESLGKNIDFTHVCESCGAENTSSIPLSEIVKVQGSDFKDIVHGKTTVKIGDILSKQYYDKYMSETDNSIDKFMVDFIFHVHAINGNEGMSYDEIVEYFDNMDVNELDSILDLWEGQKFKINDVVDIECDTCKHVEQFSFDEIPDFIPVSWFSR